MLRRIALALGLLWTAPALALPPLASGSAVPLPGATVTMDFVNNQFYGTDFAQGTNFQRAGTKTNLFPISPSGFAYTTYAAGVPVIVPGLGISSEEVRTNYFLTSTAPATQTITIPSTGTYTLWQNGPGSSTVAAGTATCTIGNGAVATQGASVQIQCQVVGTVTVTISGSPLAVQFEKGVGGTSYIPTAGAAVARVADTMTASGPSNAWASNASVSGTVIVAATETEATAGFTTLWGNAGGGMIGNYDANININKNDGSSPLGGTLGRGRAIEGYKVGFTWSPAGRIIVGNGSPGNTGGGTQYPNNSANIRLGSSGSSNWCNCFISRFDFWPVLVSADFLRTQTMPASGFRWAAFGDSLTARNVNSVFTSYPMFVEQFSGLPVLNGGIEGDSSTQIATRFLNTSAIQGLPLMIWSGRNNIAASATIQSDIASMVAVQPNAMVLGIINGETEQSGSANYTTITGINSALASTYGSRFTDVRAALVAAYNPANPVDVLDHTNDTPAYSLRQILPQGTIPAGLTSAATSFTTAGSNVAAGQVLLVDSEYIQVTTSSGTTVSAAVRGYAGTTATTHATNVPYTHNDVLHLGAAGYKVVAQNAEVQLGGFNGIYDFRQGPIFPAALTSSGGTNGTTTNAAGNQAAATAPRFDYSPVSPFAYKGLTVEPASTNMLLNSNGSLTTALNTTITANSATGIDNATSATTLTDTASNVQHSAQTANLSFTAGVTYTFTAYIKAGTTITRAQLTPNTAAFTPSGYANFDLTAGTVTQTGGTLIGATISQGPQGYWKCTYTAVASTTAAASVSVIMISSFNATRGMAYTGTGSGTILVSHTQVEAQTAASTPIVTTGTAVTRAADAITINPLPAANTHLFCTFTDNSTQNNTVTPGGSFTLPGVIGKDYSTCFSQP